MDIWQWVYDAQGQLHEQGHHRLATILEDISTFTCDDEHDKVDAVIGEGLALARQQPNKWIELFLRHWQLQSQVLHRRNAHMLTEAIDLLDFSHQKETKDCPQSVCVVQDLASCYETRDGPGFATERLAVCTEALARITPAWPCYNCIAAEYVSALLDQGQPAAALTQITQFYEAMFKATGEKEFGGLTLSEASALLQLGRYEQAEQVARNADDGDGGGSSFQCSKQGMIALTLAYQNKLSDAIAAAPPFEELFKAAEHYKDWCELHYVLGCNDSTYNNRQTSIRFNTMAQRLCSNGAIRDALQIYQWQAELALQRNDFFVCEQCIDSMQVLCTQLNRDLGATDALMTLRHRYNEAVALYAQNPCALQLADVINSSDDDLTAFNLFDLRALHRTDEDNDQLTRAYASALELNGYQDLAQTVRKTTLTHNPDQPQLILEFGHSLLTRHAFDDFDHFFSILNAAELSEETVLNVHWLYALRYREQEPHRALDRVRTILAARPHARNTLYMAAELERAGNNYAAAIEYYDTLIAQYEDNAHYHWERITCATLLQRWDIVRNSCTALNITLATTTGPIDEDWGTVRIRFDDQEAGQQVLFARRTGPVTAVIKELCPITEKQFYDFHIVFSPAPLNVLDQTDAEGDRCDSEGNYTFEYVAIAVTPGDDYFFFAIDGVHPGDAHWVALTEMLRANHMHISQRSSAEYEVHDKTNDMLLPGIYAFVGVPATVDLVQLNMQLLQHTEAYQHPLIWPLLVEKLGDQALLMQQAAIEERYSLN